MLIARDAAVNAKEPAQNQTALMWAAAEHHPAVVKSLIEAHADLQAHTKQGFTALHFASREGDPESARLLIAAGVDVNIKRPDVDQSGIEAVNRAGRRVLLGRLHPLLVATVGEVPRAVSARTGSRPERGCRPNLPLGFGGMGKRHRKPGVRIEDSSAGIQIVRPS